MRTELNELNIRDWLTVGEKVASPTGTYENSAEGKGSKKTGFMVSANSIMIKGSVISISGSSRCNLKTQGSIGGIEIEDGNVRIISSDPDAGTGNSLEINKDGTICLSGGADPSGGTHHGHMILFDPSGVKYQSPTGKFSVSCHRVELQEPSGGYMRLGGGQINISSQQLIISGATTYMGDSIMQIHNTGIIAQGKGSSSTWNQTPGTGLPGISGAGGWMAVRIGDWCGFIPVFSANRVGTAAQVIAQNKMTKWTSNPTVHALPPEA